MRHELTLEKFQACPDGYINVPDGPGLGLTLNEDFVKKYLVAESGK
jgi:L-alanine-DL-glutamate epimerase-like enolase superfamily enzyme